MGQNEIDIRIRCDIKVGDQRGLRVPGGIQGIHVDNVVHALDLLFDSRGKSLFEVQRIRTHGGEHLNLRRGNVRNWAIGRIVIVTAPTMTVRIAMTIATIGRLMKNLDMILLVFASSDQQSGFGALVIRSCG